MKKHITFGLFALCMAMGFAQRHEIGIKGAERTLGYHLIHLSASEEVNM